MPSLHKILGQAAPADTNNADLFTVPSARSYVVSSLVVANTTTTASTARVFARIAGDTAGTANAVLYDVSIPANSTATFSLGMAFAATDILTVRTGTANALTFTAFGSDVY
jgi:hypothetical protein